MTDMILISAIGFISPTKSGGNQTLRVGFQVDPHRINESPGKDGKDLLELLPARPMPAFSRAAPSRTVFG